MPDMIRAPQVEIGQIVRFTFFSQKFDLDETHNRWKVETVFPRPHADDGDCWYETQISQVRPPRGQSAKTIKVRDDQLIVIG